MVVNCYGALLQSMAYQCVDVRRAPLEKLSQRHGIERAKGLSWKEYA